MKSPQLRVALRADASPVSGIGHITRCSSLAAALCDVGCEVKLISRRLGLDVVPVRTSGIDLEWLPPASSPPEADDPVPHAAWAEVAWHVDAEQTATMLADWAPDWVVVDHYAFDARWHRTVANAIGTRIAAIDDLADRPLDVRYLIDQNLSKSHRKKFGRLIGPGTVLLGGPRFALLGHRYAQLKPLHVRDRVGSIGIFMGGVDAPNLSGMALQGCRRYAAFGGAIEIASTSANPHLQTLEDLTKRWPPTTLITDLPDLAGFFVRHDLQIGAAGSATWERCCAGAPTLLLSSAANQEVVLPDLVGFGAVAALGSAATAELIGRAVCELLQSRDRRYRLAERARMLVDGLGARRVALALCADTLLDLRDAVENDAARAYLWRNHPQTRRFSHDPRELGFDEHLRWWRAALQNPQRRLFVAHVGRYDVGVLRLDLRASEGKVSIYVDPALVGLKIGPAMLRAAQHWSRSRASPVTRLVAEILPQNLASHRAFESAGFEPSRGCWAWNVGDHSKRQGESNEDR